MPEKHLKRETEDGTYEIRETGKEDEFNALMRWYKKEIYVPQHIKDAQLTIQELRDMIGNEGAAFSNRVLHFASSLRGTGPYWFKQCSRLIAMVDTLGLPTVLEYPAHAGMSIRRC